MAAGRSPPIQRFGSVAILENRAQFWLDLQSQYDIAVIEHEYGAEIARRVRPADAASALRRRNGGAWRQQRIPKWRATVDEDGHYCFAVAL
jgi:hypothetical protein